MTEAINSPGDAILEVRDVYRKFGGVSAVAGAEFKVRRGSITGLLGPNGAGKTTLFNIIAGTVPPTSGEILLDGRAVTGCRPDELAHMGLTRTFQLARGLSELTVLENLALYARSQPGEELWRVFLDASSVRQREEAVIAEAWKLASQLNLAHVANNRAADLSGGQKKLVELGRALLGEPKLLLLDEPMAGVNPSLAVDLGTYLLAIRDQGVTILVIEHNMSFIRQVCDHVIVLASGKVLAEGLFEDIRANEVVQSAYLGSAI
ncbi:ABC transporter ATP-binding protein [Mesorhizobium sp. B2-6-1]|uniref:ABC transporter ATP-binding protein n=1 Tax=Mesorhizobium sp. B2-6-1 TaxID=2589916 RepID=UPI001AEEA70E|nr:ABC transporter ATP-binding protein [Mesorhizobium sp. B2-6-1]